MQATGTTGTMKTRALIAALIVIILLLLMIVILSSALLLSTGNPPEGEASGVHGVAYPVMSMLEGILAGAADLIDAIAGQIARLSGRL